MRKKLFMDSETTGLDPVRNDIIQLAFIAEIDGEVVGEKLIHMQPHSFENVEQAALDVHGLQLDQIKEYQTPAEAYKEIVGFLGQHINKYSKMDKFTAVGYNVGFDTNMLRQFFKKSGDKYYGSWVEPRDVDVMAYIYFVRSLGVRFPVENFKLGTLCALFGIDIKAHDALSDIQATRMLYNVVGNICHESGAADVISQLVR